MNKRLRECARGATWSLCCAASLICGCASSDDLATVAASSARQQLLRTSDQLASKIDAENAYYDSIVQSAIDSGVRARSDDLVSRIHDAAAQFVDNHPVNGGVSDVTSDDVANYMKDVVSDWSDAETRRQAAVADTIKQLRTNRQALELSQAQLTKLANQLEVLARARSGRELFSFYSDYAKAVKKEYERLEGEVQPPASQPESPSDGGGG